MFGQGFTEAETEIIREGVAAGLCYAEIAAKIPGRTKAAIGSKASRLGLRCRRPASENYVRDAMCRAARELETERTDLNVARDQAFQAAMRKAIAAGLEHVEEGISLVPCTDNPKIVKPYAIQFSRSPALMCFEHGDKHAGGSHYA